MSASAAPGAQLKLEQALAQWSHWQVQPRLPGAPHLLGPLDGGSSNHSFLVQAQDRRFVVRVDRVNVAANGISRQAEWHILQHAAALGIAPAPRYFNPDIGVLVCDYHAPDTDADVTPGQLAALLRSLHDLPPIHLRMDPAERIRRYLRQLPAHHSGLEALALPLLEALDRCEPGPLQVCHHDLGGGNLVVSAGQLLALDWEYVAMGSGWFDLAVVVRDRGWEGAALEELLGRYLGREATAPERHALGVQDLLSRYLELLWYASGQGDDGVDYPVEAQARALASALGVSRENC